MDHSPTNYGQIPKGFNVWGSDYPHQVCRCDQRVAALSVCPIHLCPTDPCGSEAGRLNYLREAHSETVAGPVRGNPRIGSGWVVGRRLLQTVWQGSIIMNGPFLLQILLGRDTANERWHNQQWCDTPESALSVVSKMSPLHQYRLWLGKSYGYTNLVWDSDGVHDHRIPRWEHFPAQTLT